MLRVNFGTFTLRGTDHKQNQDATQLIGQAEGFLGLVADGCSGVRFGDFASRSLVWEFLHQLDEAPAELPEGEDLTRYVTRAAVQRLHNLYPEKVVLTADRTLSTLSVIMAVEQRIRVDLMGDGLLLVRFADGEYQQITVAYEGNAPWYPMYTKLLDPKREFTQYIYHTSWWTNQDTMPVTTRKTRTHVNTIDDGIMSFALHKKPAAVCLVTDGLLSRDKPFSSDIVELLLRPKTGEGEWAQRLMNVTSRKHGPFTDDVTGIQLRLEEQEENDASRT